jgi:hypothetical protein
MTSRNRFTWSQVAFLALAPALLVVAGCVSGGKDGKDGATGATGRTGNTGQTGETGETGPARTVIIDNR